MRKTAIAILLSCTLAAGMILSGCASEKKKLVMATEAGFRPYEYRDDADNSKIVGVDVEIANEIAKSMNMELEIVDMEFTAIIEAVKSGKADFGAAGISIDEDRKTQVDFTIPYAASKQVVLTRNDSGIASPGDIADKVVAVQAGTVADFALSEEADYPDIQLKRPNKYLDALADMQNGRIDCIVLDYLPALELQKTADNLVILDEELFIDEYAICVSKGNQELLDKINGVLQRLISEGQIDAFTVKHLG